MIVSKFTATDRSSSSINYRIPIFFHIIRDNAGQSINCDYNIFSACEEVSSYFSLPQCSNTTIEFYPCGVDNIDNTDFLSLDISNLTERTLMYNASHTDQAINVYLVSSIFDPTNPFTSGIAWTSASDFPNNMIAVKHSATIQTLVHELGHYFSLMHTFQGGPTDQLVNSPVTYTTTTSNGNTFTFTSTCSTNGDKICDTPADPGGFYCLPDCTVPLFCSINDLAGVPYNPDRTNIMSYYNCNTKHFSCQQFDRMIMELNSNRSFLLNSSPTCQFLPAKRGNVYRNCAGIANSPEISPLNLVNMNIQYVNSTGTTVKQYSDKSDPLGRYDTWNCSALPSNFAMATITPETFYQHPLNGVSTYDLLQISKHILGIAPFTSPYQIISADANNSGSVTSFDILTIRKVLLGITPDFAPVGNWRYVPQYCFDDPIFSTGFNATNPFAAVWNSPTGQRTYLGANSFMDKLALNLNNPKVTDAKTWSFNAAKTGDVDCNAQTDLLSTPPFPVIISNPVAHGNILEGQYFTLNIRSKSGVEVNAYQMGMSFAKDSIQVLSVNTGTVAGFAQDNFGLNEVNGGKLRALWFDPAGQTMDIDNKFLFKIQAKALKNINAVDKIIQLNGTVLPCIFYGEEDVPLEEVEIEFVVSNISNVPAPESPNAKISYNESGADLSVRPNPTNGMLSFVYQSETMGNAILAIYNQFGQLVESKKLEVVIGENNWMTDKLASMPVGLYTYILNDGSTSLHGKIQKI